jgi:hypothetical protein
MQPIHLDEIVVARDLLTLSGEELLQRYDNVLTMPLKFDDGTIATVNGRKTIVSTIYWDYHRVFPQLQLLPHHHIGNVVFGNSVHKKLISAPLWETFGQGICQDMDKLNRMAMVVFNNIFVFTGEELEEYVTTISVIDYLDLVEHPVIAKAIVEARPSTASIEKTYIIITDIVMRCPTLNGNAISMACRASLISIGQVLQALLRGFITDYDSNIFRKPIMTGYAEGLKILAESAQESRSGTKALKATTEPLRKTEYFGRKIALQNQYIKSLVPGDCGSTGTVEFMVTKKSLVNLAGKIHKLPDGTLEEINQNSNHLEGSLIRLRSPLECKHRSEYKVCETCAGGLSYSIPSTMYYRQETRLGHICAIALCSFVTQKVMGVKHEDGSSVAEHLNIVARDAEFIKLNGADPSKIQFHMELKNQNPRLVIPEEYVKYLDDINNPDVKDVKILPTTTLAAMAEIVLQRTVKNSKGQDEEVEDMIPTSVGPRLASFTYDFLEHLKKYGWTVNGYGDYVIDLTQWRFSKPFLVMPQRHMNMLEYMQSISEFIEKKSRNGVYGCKTSAEALRKVYDIVNSRASVNVFHLEVLLMGSLVTDNLRANSAAPGLGDGEETFNIHRENMFNRSASGAMAFERHGDVILKASSYNNKNKPDHGFDNILRG